MVDFNNINSVNDSIRANINIIKEDYNNGCTYAKAVISYLRMHLSCPYDPGAQGFLMSAYQDYCDKKKGAVQHERK